jgi:hypothetical protein
VRGKCGRENDDEKRKNCANEPDRGFHKSPRNV